MKSSCLGETMASKGCPKGWANRTEMWWQNSLGHRSNLPCGLVTYTSGLQTKREEGQGGCQGNNADDIMSRPPTPVSLRSVDVIGVVVDCGMDLTISQLFENRDSVSKDMFYILPFPLAGNVGLYRFEFKVYSPSIPNGPGSREGEPFQTLVINPDKQTCPNENTKADHCHDYLAKNTEFFKARIGSVKPLQLIQIRLAFVSVVEEVLSEAGDESSLLITVPSIVFPNYGNRGGPMDEDTNKNFWNGRENEWFAAHADYPVKLFMRVFQQFACDFKLMTKMGEFTVRDSRGYRCTSQLDTWYPYCVQAVCRKADAVSGLSIKFSPTFDLSREARLVVEHHQGRSVAILSLCCDMEPADEAEVLFLLDQSGSMIGSPMHLAKSVLMNFLRKLPPTVKFNVLGFGSDHGAFFKQSKMVNEETLDQVRTFLENADAVLGASNILGAMEFALAKFCCNTVAKNLVIISDGKVEEMDKVMQFVQGELDRTRIFTVDVGGSELYEGNDYLREIATMGGGHCEVVQQHVNVDGCIHNMISRFLQPSIEIVEVQFFSQLGHDLHVTFAPDMVMTDHNKPILYGRTRHNIFLCFQEKEVKNSVRATIQLRGSRGLETMEISSSESPATYIGDIGATRLFHRLWCQRLNSAVLQAVQHNYPHGDEYFRKQVVHLQELSLDLNLVSPFSQMTLQRNSKAQTEASWAYDTRFLQPLKQQKSEEITSVQTKPKRKSRIFTPPLWELYNGEYSVSVIRELMRAKEICLTSSLQHADGSFDLDKSFCGSVGIDYNFLNCSKKKTVSKRSWATSIAFVVLQNRLSLWHDSEERLDEVLAKATSWMRRNISDEVEISECVHLALKILWKFFAQEPDRQTDKKRQSYTHFYS